MDKPIFSGYKIYTVFKRVHLMVGFLHGKYSGKRGSWLSNIKKKIAFWKVTPHLTTAAHRILSFLAQRFQDGGEKTLDLATFNSQTATVFLVTLFLNLK
jgi:hypothetical protein